MKNVNFNNKDNRFQKSINTIKHFLDQQTNTTKKTLQTLLAMTLLVWWVASYQKCSSEEKSNDKVKTELTSEKKWTTSYQKSSSEEKSNDEVKTKLTSEKKISVNELKKKPINLSYKEIFPEQKIQFIKFPKVSHSDMIQSRIKPEERILRCMRRKAITDAAEDKYEIPRGLLIAMMAQEGAGDPTLPNVKKWNSKDKKHYKITQSDWGLGLLHIQGANAEDFGLKVIQTSPGKPNSREMIDIKLGDKIIEALYKNKQDLKKLSEIDERWHPIEAVDCSARYLKHCFETEKKGKHDWIGALHGYSGRGRHNKHSYPKRVLDYRVAIDQYINKGRKSSIPPLTQDPKLIQEVNNYIEKQKKSWLFEKLQKMTDEVQVKIGEKEGWYDLYLDYHRKQCENYELSKYKNHTLQAK